MEKKEKELCKRQLARKEKDYIILNESLKYNQAVVEFNKNKRIFDDKWRMYLRSQIEKEENKSLKLIMDELENINIHIKQLSANLLIKDTDIRR